MTFEGHVRPQITPPQKSQARQNNSPEATTFDVNQNFRRTQYDTLYPEPKELWETAKGDDVGLKMGQTGVGQVMRHLCSLVILNPFYWGYIKLEPLKK